MDLELSSMDGGLDQIDRAYVCDSNGTEPDLPHLVLGDVVPTARTESFWAKFKGAGQLYVPGWAESARNTVCHSSPSWFVFIPFSWATHWAHWHCSITIVFSLLALIPLKRLSIFGGEQIALYLGIFLGDLLVITLHNVVEVTLVITLLTRCELKLVQNTLTGFILLHLLLAPGTASLTGSVPIWNRRQIPYRTRRKLLTLGVMVLIIPIGLLHTLPRSPSSRNLQGSTTDVVGRLMASGNQHARAEGVAISGATTYTTKVLAMTDLTQDIILKFGHGLSILLLIMYIVYCIYWFFPPGTSYASNFHRHGPGLRRRRAVKLALEQEVPLVGPGFGVVSVAVTTALIAVTADWIVLCIEEVQGQGTISSEWLGLFMLPLLCFFVDRMTVVVCFLKTILSPNRNHGSTKAHAKVAGIDLSIQFTLFWIPCMVLLGWSTHHPLPLLFDLWQVAMLMSACVLANIVTTSPKISWAEVIMMLGFYVEAAWMTWFYYEQPRIQEMLQCGTAL